METKAVQQPGYITVEAVVIRKDGTREPLGVVAYYSRNPLKQLWYDVTGQVFRWPWERKN